MVARIRVGGQEASVTGRPSCAQITRAAALRVKFLDALGAKAVGREAVVDEAAVRAVHCVTVDWERYVRRRVIGHRLAHESAGGHQAGKDRKSVV